MEQKYHEIYIEDQNRTVKCSEQESVLQAMLRIGDTTIPIGCKGGGCGICRVQVLEGDYQAKKMSRCHISEDMLAQQRLLACRIYPRGNLRLRLDTPQAGIGQVFSQKLQSLTIRERSLHWEAAVQASQAAIRKAIELDICINVAVVDRGGNLLAFQRMNGAPLHSISIAQDKAYTAVSFGFSTGEWMNLIGDNPALREGLVQRDRLVIFGGGLPVKESDVLIGGVGVSGGSEEQDEICAEAALEALQLHAA